MDKRILLALAALIFVLASASPARADFAGVPDRVQLAIGGTAAELSTQAALSPESGGAGAALDFEDLFDIPGSHQSVRADGFWRFSEKGYVDFGYVEFNRSGARELDQDIQWAGYTIQAGSLVGGKWDSSFPYVAYRHDFLHEEKVKISGSAGFSYLRLAPSLAAQGSILDPDGIPVAGGAYEKGVDVQYPVPLVGLRLDWALHNRLTLDWFVRFFYLNFSGIEGGMRESSVRLNWHFSKHVGIAGGYDSSTVGIKQWETENYKAKFRYDVTGLSAYLTLAF
jgi:hypothetical protein